MTDPQLLPTTQRLMDRAETLAALPPVLDQAEQLARQTFHEQGLAPAAAAVGQARQELEAEAVPAATALASHAKEPSRTPSAPLDQRELWKNLLLFIILGVFLAATVPHMIGMMESLTQDLRARP